VDKKEINNIQCPTPPVHHPMHIHC